MADGCILAHGLYSSSVLFFTCADKQNKVLNKQNEKKNKHEMSKKLHETKIQFRFNWKIATTA